MAIGALLPPNTVPLPGLSVRSTNLSASLYTPFSYHTKNIGHVSSESAHVRVFLYNGTEVPASVSELMLSQAGGINISGVASGTTVPAKTSVVVDMEITAYGPPEFAAVFVFVFSCSLSPQLTVNGTRPIFATEQPTPITLDQAIAEAYAEPYGEIFYDTLEFYDSISGDKMLVVYSDEELSTPQGVFTPCKFECKHPETEGGIVGTMQIVINYLPRRAQRWIMETCKNRGNVTVYWRQYLGPDQEPDAHYPIPLNVTSVDQTPMGATINATFPMLTAMKFPRRIMSTTILPGGRI